jgi:hypothetical protein
MTLTTDQITDLRADLGDQTVPYAFSDIELDRLYVRSNMNWEETLRLAIAQLLMNTAKFYNYKAGYTAQDEAQVFEHLLKMQDVFLSQKNGAYMVGIALVPTKHKQEPRSQTGSTFIGPTDGSESQ